MSKIKIINTHDLMEPHVHGYHEKDLFVLHETVSKDVPGISDIMSVEKYLADKDYGIHGMTDLEGNIAWALGLGNAIFWQAGGVNERSAGCEQVSYIPYLIQKGYITLAHAAQLWNARTLQLNATGRLIAAWHNVSPQDRPLAYSNGTMPGITSHWDVSQHFPASEGHTDCWPIHRGGYFPLLKVIQLAKNYVAQDVHF